MSTHFNFTKKEYFDLVAKVFPELSFETKFIDLNNSEKVKIETIAIECLMDSWRLSLDENYTDVFIETKIILNHFRKTDELRFKNNE